MKKFTVLTVLAAFVAGAFALSTAEAQEKKKKRDPEAVFKRLDKNSDGKLSLEEFTSRARKEEAKARAEKRFKVLDKNSDGSVSLEEFKAGAKKKKKKGE